VGDEIEDTDSPAGRRERNQQACGRMIDQNRQRSHGVCPMSGPESRPRIRRRCADNATARRSAVAVLIAGVALFAIAADAPSNDDGLDPVATLTRFVVIRVGKDGKGRPIVALANPTSTDNPAQAEGTFRGILARELFRQALLIAARDELGMATRDEVLGDPAPDAETERPNAAKEEVALELATAFRTAAGTASQVIIRREKDKNFETLLNRDPGSNMHLYSELPKLAEFAEKLSRNEFPAVLKQIGVEGKPNPLRDDQGLPAGVEDRLAHLGLIELFAAVRDLHSAIRTNGETPARVGALVRGYALMGLLTEHLWHPVHKVFKARALLYAQRLVARDEKSVFGLWHRAYAEALIGIHNYALADIAEARALAKAAGDPKSPVWAALIDAYASQDITRMNVEKGPTAPLASLLRLMVLEYPLMTDLTLLAAKDVLAFEPTCYRAHDVMCQVGGLTNLQETTEIGPAVLARTLAEKLRAVDSFPRAVLTNVDNAKGVDPAIFKALKQAGAPSADAGEPSWAVLGRLIQEIRFVQIYRRLHLMRTVWSVPVAEFWNESAATVAEHPYRSYLETLVWARPQANRALVDQIEQIDIANVQVVSVSMLSAIYRSQHPKARLAWTFAVQHIDNNAHDLAELVQNSDALDKPVRAQSLLAVSPKSLFAKAVIIEKDWDRAKPHLAEWERDAEGSPALLAALAKRYTELGKTEQAERALLRYIRFSPDLWAYQQLGKSYKDKGDWERWQVILEEYLAKVEDHGLDHARVRVEIANQFMELKKWDEAWPFAEAAAESGAAWALMCAQQCAEGMKDWEAAESYAEQISKRYPNRWPRWFLFCKQHGLGDVAAARALCEQHLEPIIQQPGQGDPAQIGYFYWLAGDLKKAMLWFRQAYSRSPNHATCFNLILLADEIGDTATRDESVRTLLAKHRRLAPKACQIYEILRKTLNTDAPPAVDLQAVEKVLKDASPASRGLNSYLVGLFLKNHGQVEDARRYLRVAVDSSGVHEWGQAVAADALRHLGGDENTQRSDPAPAQGGK
jgi:tetratricopeptide (TPR) repeat protein